MGRKTKPREEKFGRFLKVPVREVHLSNILCFFSKGIKYQIDLSHLFFLALQSKEIVGRSMYWGISTFLKTRMVTWDL